MADPAIQYEDGGPDTSVLAPAHLTGPAPASVLSDSPPGATGSVSRDSAIPGFDPQGAMSDLAGAASRKLGDDNYIRSEFDSRIKQDRERMDRALSVETATANDPALTHPWNADQERAERIKGPLENFGSFASIFALAASAFTRTPMNSALNAAGAAMTAMHQNDELAYKSAYQAWKDNTELVQKRFNMERAVYDDATKLASTDLATATHKLAIGAAQFNDQKIAIMAEHGMIPEIFQTLDARANAMEKLQKYKQDYENFTLTADIGKDKFDKWKTEHPAPAGFDQWMKLPPGSAPPPGSASAKELVQYGADMRAAEHQTLLEAKREVAEAGRAGLRTGAGAMPTANRLSAGDLEKEIQEKLKSGELQQKDVADYRAKRSGELKTEAQGTGKTDAAITNTLAMYPGMSKGDLGYISPTAQPKLIIALRDSPENLETIAGYAKAHPESIGLIADATKRINLDAYQALFKSDPAAAKAKLDVDRDAAIDQVAKEKKLDLSQAAQAKVLQKLLTTQAFTDAALAGSRGATIYLDKAFREIYDPTSSPGAFFSILEKRYDEADRQAEKYKLGFDRRSDEALAKMPFWQQKAAGFAGKEVDKPPAPGAKQAKDGNWYVPDPDRPGKYLQVK